MKSKDKLKGYLKNRKDLIKSNFKSIFKLRVKERKNLRKIRAFERQQAIEKEERRKDVEFLRKARRNYEERR